MTAWCVNCISDQYIISQVVIHLLPPYLQGDNYILIATDISDLKKKIELNEIIAELVNTIEDYGDYASKIYVIL